MAGQIELPGIAVVPGQMNGQNRGPFLRQRQIDEEDFRSCR
jgi:hypothetical protein